MNKRERESEILGIYGVYLMSYGSVCERARFSAVRATTGVY